MSTKKVSKVTKMTILFFRKKWQIAFLLIILLMPCSSILASSLLTSSLGYSPTDNTEILRQAFTTAVDTIIIDKQDGPWRSGPLRFFNLENKTIIFEEGVTLQAIEGAFGDPQARFIDLRESSNVTVIGYGAEIRMNKAEYIALSDSEYRHGISLFNCSNINIEGFTISDTGGDGIYIGGETNNGLGQGYCKNVSVKNVVCTNNYRQGMSVASVENLEVSHCVFKKTSGTLPEAGLDIEPYRIEQRIVNCKFTKCSFTENNWVGIAVALPFMDSTSMSVTIEFEDCYLRDNRKNYGNPYAFTEIALLNNGASPVKGQLTFDKTIIDGSNWTAVYSTNPAAGFKTTFSDCVFKDVSQEPILYNEPIFFETPDFDNPIGALGNMTFDNVTISYNTDFDLIRVLGGGQVTGLRGLEGQITRLRGSEPTIDLDGLSQLDSAILAIDHIPASNFPGADAGIYNISNQIIFDECEEEKLLVQSELELVSGDYPLFIKYNYEGSASPGYDYDYQPPCLVVSPGDQVRFDTIGIRKDQILEGKESLDIRAVNTTEYDLTNDLIEVEIEDCSEFELSTSTLYPLGEKMTVGLYALYENFEEASSLGWNLGHTYQEAPVSDQYFDTLELYGMDAMARLSYIDSIGEKWAMPEEVIRQEILAQAKNGNLAWWDLPEELRYWIANEVEILQTYSQLTRELDPFQRPNFMYIPGHYDEDDISNYLPYLDIVPASAYPNWQEQPHSYVRWSIERTREAIIGEGFVEGSDYLNGEKTIMSILELFDDNGMTPQGTWHDYWLSIASGAKGVLVFSHIYRDASEVLAASWQELNRANDLLTTHRLNEAIINGTDLDADVKVTAGPTEAPSIIFDDVDVTYSSLAAKVMSHDDRVYAIVVNSAESEVSGELDLTWSAPYTVTNLETGNSFRNTDELLSFTLPGLGVLIYEISVENEDKISYVDTTDLLFKVNGEDFLPIGFYAEGMDFEEYPDFADRIAAGGFNILYTESDVANEPEYDTFLNRCEELELNNILGLPYTFLGDDPQYYVNAYKDYPSVVSWNVMDDANNFDVAQIQAQREAVLVTDNTRVTSASWYDNGPLEAMIPSVELALMQSYPWQNGAADLVQAHSVLLGTADTSRLLGKYPIATPQTFNWDDSDYPPAEHLYCQSYLGFATGNKGLMYYTFKDYDNNSTIDITQPELYTTAVRVADEVLNSELKDVILYGEFEHGNIDFYRYYGKWTYNGNHYYIILNANDELTYDYSIPIEDEMVSIQPLFTDGLDPFSLDGNSMTGQLGPYEVAIYKTSTEPVAVDNEEESLFEVYPNPVRDMLYIRSSEAKVSCLIYNAHGRRVMHSTSKNIDISALSPGLYILESKGLKAKFVKI